MCFRVFYLRAPKVIIINSRQVAYARLPQRWCKKTSIWLSQSVRQSLMLHSFGQQFPIPFRCQAKKTRMRMQLTSTLTLSVTPSGFSWFFIICILFVYFCVFSDAYKFSYMHIFVGSTWVHFTTLSQAENSKISNKKGLKRHNWEPSHDTCSTQSFSHSRTHTQAGWGC